MMYRSVGRMAGGVSFISIPAEIVRRLGIQKGDTVGVTIIEGGFKVMVLPREDKPKEVGVEFD